MSVQKQKILSPHVFTSKTHVMLLIYEEDLMRAIHLKIISTCAKQYNCLVIPSKNHFL